MTDSLTKIIIATKIIEPRLSRCEKKNKKRDSARPDLLLNPAKVAQINLENCKGFFYIPHNESLFEAIVLRQQRFPIGHDFIMHAT